ncbi:MAG: hypothetical protein IT204_04995, partial [Fimbriimonadaceae bacterium]|nr:hypothetical protein [Fimbriimonadaceae bacterium]
MAVRLVGVTGAVQGQAWPLRAGELAVGSAAEADLVLPVAAGVAPQHAVLQVSRKQISIAPVGNAPVVVNGELIAVPTALRPNDRLALGGAMLLLDVGQAELPATPAADPHDELPAPALAAGVGVALPPPDPPRWRLLLPLLGVALTVALGVLVVKLAPAPQTVTSVPLPPAVREQVRRSTVWIRAQVAEGESEGSGFVSRQGWVLTNAHVV